MELGQSVLALIGGNLWDSTSWGIEDIPLVFSIVPDQYGAFTHYLEVGPFMYNFIFPTVRGPCLWSDEEIMCAGEVVYVVEGEVMDLSCIVLQIQGDCT